MVIGANLRVVYNMGLKGPIFEPQNRSKVPVIGHFLQQVSTGLTSVLFHMLIVTTFRGV